MGKVQVRRKLSYFDSVNLVLGSMVGSGIFFTPNEIATSVPNRIAYICLWIFGGLLAISGAFTYAALARRYPDCGGTFLYVRELFGPRWAFLNGWLAVLVMLPTFLAAVSFFAATIIGGTFGIKDEQSCRLLAAGLVCAVALLLMLGVKTGARFHNTLTIVKVTGIATLVIAAATIVVARGVPMPAGEVPVAEIGATTLILAMLPIMFAYGGFQRLGMLAAVVDDPEKTVPRAIFAAVGIAIFIFVILNLSYLATTSIADIAAHRDFVARTAQVRVGNAGELLVRAIIGVAAVGSIVVSMTTTPWVIVEMGNRGAFFRSCGRLSARAEAPSTAIMVFTAATLIYLLAIDIKLFIRSGTTVMMGFEFLVAGAVCLLAARGQLGAAGAAEAAPGLRGMLPFVLFAGFSGIAVIIAVVTSTALFLGISVVVVGAGLLTYAVWIRTPAGETPAQSMGAPTD